MLQLKDKPLPKRVASQLAAFQQSVNANVLFQEKVAEGKRLFKAKNKKTNATFRKVREHLEFMSGGTVRCNYCEDSNANQVEHIYPKNYYPEKCFIWENYCYACGPCNQPKSDKFSVFDGTTGQEVNLNTLQINTPPPVGQALLLDPRSENALDYLFLDTQDTFKFVPFVDAQIEKRRAEYTIEVLGLNSRNQLVRARAVAFANFKARLYEYVNKKEAGEPRAQLAPLIASLKNEHHQTVWQEMIRQRRLHPEVDELLARAPEALTWR